MLYYSYPLLIGVGALYGLLAGVRKGLFLCDAEALACDLLGELLVKLVVFLFTIAQAVTQGVRMHERQHLRDGGDAHLHARVALAQ